MANCLSGSGTVSTTTPPTAISGAERGPVRTATGSATPMATTAAVTPASAAKPRGVVLIAASVVDRPAPAANHVTVP